MYEGGRRKEAQAIADPTDERDDGLPISKSDGIVEVTEPDLVAHAWSPKATCANQTTKRGLCSISTAQQHSTTWPKTRREEKRITICSTSARDRKLSAEIPRTFHWTIAANSNPVVARGEQALLQYHIISY